MGGGYQIDVVAADFLQGHHHLCQTFVFNRPSFPLDGNRPVLTEDTAKITIGEKNRTGSVLAD